MNDAESKAFGIRSDHDLVWLVLSEMDQERRNREEYEAAWRRERQERRERSRARMIDFPTPFAYAGSLSAVGVDLAARGADRTGFQVAFRKNRDAEHALHYVLNYSVQAEAVQEVRVPDEEEI